jgi:hypothetical protein
MTFDTFPLAMFVWGVLLGAALMRLYFHDKYSFLIGYLNAARIKKPKCDKQCDDCQNNYTCPESNK